MDGISRTSGIGPTITLEGETYTVNARILRHYGEIEAEIIKRRGNPFDLIRQACDALSDHPEHVVAFANKTFDEVLKLRWGAVTLADIGEFLSTTWFGECFSLWLAIRENNPQKLTFKYVSDAFSDEYERRITDDGYESATEWKESIYKAQQQATGTDELGNSTGSPSPEAEQANQE